MAGAIAIATVAAVVPSASAATPPGSACKKIYFVGSRGSGEHLDDTLTQAEKDNVEKLRKRGDQKAARDYAQSIVTYGFGKEVARVYAEYLKYLPAGVTQNDVGTMFNTYEAASTDLLKPTEKETAALRSVLEAPPVLKPVALARAEKSIESYWFGDRPGDGADKFVGSANSGNGVLTTLLTNRLNTCKDAKFVLAGYSQGAMAVHQLMKDLNGKPAGNAIIGAFLVADGDRDGTQAFKFGSAQNDTGATGVRAALGTLIPSVKPRPADVVHPEIVADICDSGDIVCDINPNTLLNWNKGSAIHTAYSGDDNRDIPDAVGKWASRINGRLQNGSLYLSLDGLPTATLNQQYDYTVKARGGDGHYKFTFTNLPPGLKQVGDRITGKPKQFGNWPVSLAVTDGQGQTAQTTKTLSVQLKK
ncbi:cutinase family protein [Pseudonocardia sp. RS11V-5]|uniref:cutinase family protein n=1 Tax=Pseudonocardia terrae TaxID=2905831 RepID=UPI001E4BF39C|nr:cutinase family protein [Pseudonocardia terrae]MCE3556455.1 cutinase family protein [Pseudonocardia terrae]